MQAEANILERIAQAYRARRSVRLLCVLGVASAALLLFVLAGGFPPFAWRLLARVLPQFPALEAARGSAALIALIGLILLSLTILLAWGALLWLSWKMLAYWRYERQELRNFASDVEQAYSLAEDEEATYAAQYREDEACAEDEYEEEEYQAQIGQAPYELARRRSPYPLASQTFEELDEDDPYQGEEDDEYAEDEESEEELGFYQDEEEGEDEEDEDFWRTAPVPSRMAHARGTWSGAGPTRVVREDAVSHPSQGRVMPSSPQVVRARSDAPFTGMVSAMDRAGAPPAIYDQQITEHPGPGVHSDNIKHSSYGRVVPFALPSTPETRTQPATGLYARVPLPSAVTPEPAARRLTAQLIVSTGLDVGLARKGKPNEDSLLALHNTRVLRGSPCPVGLFVVADGMGGHANGQEASRLVIQSLSRTIVPSIIYGPTDDNYAELLVEGVHRANLEVYQRNRQEKVNMGTTIAAALVVDTTAYVVNAGDSRVYLYRASSGLSQVTRDHSTVARLVENGLIQPEDVYTHPRRNEIYRSLGHHPSEDLDRFILALQPDDLLLLCSDGLWEMVRDAQIEQVIASTLHQPTQISAALVQAALAGGGKDNISVIVVYVKAIEAAQVAARTTSA